MNTCIIYVRISPKIFVTNDTGTLHIAIPIGMKSIEVQAVFNAVKETIS